MGWFNDDHDCSQAYNDYQDVQPQEHRAKISHELIGGAAAFEAAKAYENHCAENGRPQSHAEAKELAAGFAGAFIDREVETKGLDFVDSQRAKQYAQQQCYQGIADSGDY